MQCLICKSLGHKIGCGHNICLTCNIKYNRCPVCNYNMYEDLNFINKLRSGLITVSDDDKLKYNLCFAEHGNVDAIHKLWKHYKDTGDIENEVKWITAGFNHGHYESMEQYFLYRSPKVLLDLNAIERAAQFGYGYRTLYDECCLYVLEIDEKKRAELIHTAAQNGGLREWLGYAHYLRIHNRCDEAKVWYEKCLIKRDVISYDEACAGLGEICEKEGKLKDAENFYKRATSQSDYDYICRIKLGILLYSRGENPGKIFDGIPRWVEYRLVHFEQGRRGIPQIYAVWYRSRQST